MFLYDFPGDCILYQRLQQLGWFFFFGGVDVVDRKWDDLKLELMLIIEEGWLVEGKRKLVWEIAWSMKGSRGLDESEKMCQDNEKTNSCPDILL